jgi:hypothetical protein
VDELSQQAMILNPKKFGTFGFGALPSEVRMLYLQKLKGRVD